MIIGNKDGGENAYMVAINIFRKSFFAFGIMCYETITFLIFYRTLSIRRN